MREGDSRGDQPGPTEPRLKLVGKIVHYDADRLRGNLKVFGQAPQPFFRFLLRDLPPSLLEEVERITAPLRASSDPSLTVAESKRDDNDVGLFLNGRCFTIEVERRANGRYQLASGCMSILEEPPPEATDRLLIATIGSFDPGRLIGWLKPQDDFPAKQVLFRFSDLPQALRDEVTATVGDSLRTSNRFGLEEGEFTKASHELRRFLMGRRFSLEARSGSNDKYRAVAGTMKELARLPHPAAFPAPSKTHRSSTGSRVLVWIPPSKVK